MAELQEKILSKATGVREKFNKHPSGALKSIQDLELQMANVNDVLAIAFIDEFKWKELNIDKNENLQLEPHSECCIYRVPKDLRKTKEEDYTPQVISIGPLHYGKQELRDMEMQKLRYKREFSERITPGTWQNFVSYIEQNERNICNCYEDMPKFTKLEFLTMVLYDAVFIIEFFLRNFHQTSDFLLDKPRVRNSILADLTLLENQLPYKVLKALYRLAYRNLCDSTGLEYPAFFSLCSGFFKHFMGSETIRQREVEVKHFTDLLRYMATTAYSRPSTTKYFTDLPCAVKLRESGIKFHCTDHCLIDIRVEKKKSRIPCFQVSELQIPKIQIDYTTECLIRNMMALEQCLYPDETLICNYMDLMDNLINTEKDVDLLVDAAIITNFVGDTARIAKMFNSLCLRITLSDSCYAKIEDDLKVHYSNRWNHTKATLKRVYFSNYWKGTGTIAATVLLLLTLIQTICSIKQVV